MKWQPISTTPKDGTWILTWTWGIQRSDGPWMVVRGNGGEWVDEVGGWYDPTHWMPLPEPPK